MKRFIVLFMFVFAFFSGCLPEKEAERIEFDNSEPLALAPGVRWAVVTEPYSALRTSAGWEFPVNAYSRRGEIHRITGNKTVFSPDGTASVWLRFEGGWLPSSAVTVCYNLFNARTVSAQIKK